MRTLRTSSFVALVLASAFGAAALAACGGSSHALVPVDSPLLTWAPPEQEEAPAEAAPAPAAKPAEPHGK